MMKYLAKLITVIAGVSVRFVWLRPYRRQPRRWVGRRTRGNASRRPDRAQSTPMSGQLRRGLRMNSCGDRDRNRDTGRNRLVDVDLRWRGPDRYNQSVTGK
jgi:hypothetical protein